MFHAVQYSAAVLFPYTFISKIIATDKIESKITLELQFIHYTPSLAFEYIVQSKKSFIHLPADN
jgi:hypothetical protein